MAGHSKWANIKHKKAKEDAKRGKAFTKLIKEITVVARTSGGDPASNPRLRTLIEKAKEINMPQENITRAIKKGTGELPGVNYEAITYEGYGPENIAIIIDVLTDNKNRTVAELRKLFTKNGGNLGETGSVNWMFEHKGVIRVTGQTTEDELLESLLDYEVDDIKYDADNEIFFVYCEPKSMENIKKALVAQGLTIKNADLEWVAKTPADVPENKTDKAYEFLSTLDDHDDVQNIYTNLA